MPDWLTSNLRKMHFKVSILIYPLLIKFVLLIFASQIPFFGGIDFIPNLSCSEGALPALCHFSMAQVSSQGRE